MTPGFVQGFGIQPAIGRGFDNDAFKPGGPNVALISDRLWRSRYAADPAIVGRQFNAYVSDRPDEAEAFTIIGVMPADFWHLNPYTEVLVPLRAATYPYMVRLREGVQPGVATDRITALVRAGTTMANAEWRANLESTHAAYVERLRPILRSVAIAAGLVLLVALANVAGLLLIRTTRRQKEIAVRRALGASRIAVARLLLIEAVIIGAGATLVGVLAGGLLMQWLAPIVQRELGRTAPGGVAAFSFDTPIIGAAALCGLLAAIACTVGPLLAASRVGLLGSLQGGGRGTTEGRGSQRAPFRAHRPGSCGLACAPRRLDPDDAERDQSAPGRFRDRGRQRGVGPDDPPPAHLSAARRPTGVLRTGARARRGHPGHRVRGDHELVAAAGATAEASAGRTIRRSRRGPGGRHRHEPGLLRDARDSVGGRARLHAARSDRQRAGRDYQRHSRQTAVARRRLRSAPTSTS